MTFSPVSPDTIALLECMGFQFALDYDGSLVWRAPESIDVGRVIEVVMQSERGLAQGLEFRAQRNLRRCYGGPFDGRKFDWWNPYGDQSDYYQAAKIGRAKWAVYRVMFDGRAFFVGYAKSQAKGRRGNVYERAREATT